MPTVPDPKSRGTVEQLLYEMDVNGVEAATIVCAQIDHNLDNNDYVAEAVRRHPGRLYQMADVDSYWSDSHGTPGAAARLAQAARKYGLGGFTHYVGREDDGGWLLSAEGLAFFAMAERLRLIASVSMRPALQGKLRQLAARFPGVPFLVHHFGYPRANEPAPRPLFAEILASSRVPNIYVKMSGFHYASSTPGEYPYADCTWIVRGLYEHYGPDRILWGSDYPVSRAYLTYTQALDAFRRHCPFIPEGDMAKLLGLNLRRLFAEHTPGEVSPK